MSRTRSSQAIGTASVGSAHPRRPDRLTASRLIAVLGIVTSIATAGCSDDTPRPHLIWEGEHLRFGTDSDAEICEGTLPYLDGLAGHLQQTLEGHGTVVDYYWLPDGRIDSYCGEGPLACVPGTPEAFTPFIIHQHELAHAVRAPDQLYLPLEEGLAELYGDDMNLLGSVRGDVDDLLQEHQYPNRPSFGSYPLAGHFVSYLRAEHGQSMLNELDRVSEVEDSYSWTRGLFRDVYGVDLEQEIERYEATYPRCGQRKYRDKSFECRTSSLVRLSPMRGSEPSCRCHVTIRPCSVSRADHAGRT